MWTWDEVARIARTLPDAEETTTYGQPCFKVRGRPFVNTGRVEGAIVTRCSDEERDLLILARPDELAGRLEDSYAFMAAKPPARPRKRR